MRTRLLVTIFLFCNIVFAQNKLKEAKENLKSTNDDYLEITQVKKEYVQPNHYSLEEEDNHLFDNLFLELTAGLVYYTVFESPMDFDEYMSNKA